MTFRSASLLACSLLAGGTSLYLHTNVLAPIEQAGYYLVSFVSATPNSTNQLVRPDLAVDTPVEAPSVSPAPAENTIPYIVRESKRSIYEIKSRVGTGSGFIIRPGLLVTNRHVVKEETTVTLINTSTKAEIQGKVLQAETEGNDIAYIQIDDLSLIPLKVKSSSPLMEGEALIAIGSPKGLTGTVTVGVLSAQNRMLEGKSYLQHDAAISPGNSGGPVINLQGVVVGMTTLSMTSLTKNYQNLNMAVPIELIMKYAP